MISLDQMRDESPYVFVDGKKTDKNPFKDIRVRQALYQAIDIKTLQRAVMRGFSIPNGTIVSSETNGWSAKAADRLPYDPQAAKKLLAEAGYPTVLNLRSIARITAISTTRPSVKRWPACGQRSA